jgi:Domain of unknown function (DUF5122) beta-propeller
MRRTVMLGVVLACLMSLLLPAAQEQPDLSQGIQVLSMLASPYGANTYLIKDQMERMGWDVTFTGIRTSVPACSRLCSTFFVDQIVEEIETATDYDVLVVMPTPGTFTRKPNPVGDLRDSEVAINLVQEAFDAGLTLYTGCSGILMFGDAGCLDGATVIAHRNRAANCRSYGADCTIGSASTPPMIDGQLVTATNQRVWPIEIASAIARSLDGQAPIQPSIDSITTSDLALTAEAIESDDPTVVAWTLGTTLSDLGRDICIVPDGSVLVGMTYSSTGREDILVVKRTSTGDIAWAKAIGGPGRDFAEAVCASPDGGIYVAGYTTSAGNGMEDVLVLKISAAGDLSWTTTLGGADYDAAFDICSASNGGAVLCGLTYSSGAGLSDLYVAKVSSEGAVAWQRTHGGAGIERGQSIEALVDGSYIVAGGTSSFGAGNVDMYVVRLTSTGQETWSKAYGRATYDIANSIIAVSDGGFLLTGHGDREGSELSALTVVRIDDEGTELWTSRFGSGRDLDYGMDAVELNDGGFAIAAVTNEPDPGENDVWLQLIAEDGKSLAQVTFGGSESDWTSGVCLSPDGTLLVAGQTASYGKGSYDALLLELTLP